MVGRFVVDVRANNLPSRRPDWDNPSEGASEAIKLRLRQGVGAMVFDGILGGNHHERPGQLVSLVLNGDLPLTHRLQKSTLSFRSRPIDFVS